MLGLIDKTNINAAENVISYSAGYMHNHFPIQKKRRFTRKSGTFRHIRNGLICQSPVANKMESDFCFSFVNSQCVYDCWIW